MISVFGILDQIDALDTTQARLFSALNQSNKNRAASSRAAKYYKNEMKPALKGWTVKQNEYRHIQL